MSKPFYKTTCLINQKIRFRLRLFNSSRKKYKERNFGLLNMYNSRYNKKPNVIFQFWNLNKNVFNCGTQLLRKG